MNRAEFRQRAEDWVVDAQTLLNAQRWSPAYYLVGYAIECALKACILAYIEQTGAIFIKKDFKCRTHDFDDLLKLADLAQRRDQDCQNNHALGANWEVAKDWTSDSRYELKTRAQAQELFDAVTDNVSGVLQWIRAHW